MAIDRVTVSLPEGFDPRRHVEAILAHIASSQGPGWEVEWIDAGNATLTATRAAATTQVERGSHDEMVLSLGTGAKASDAARIAARFEDAHPGYKMTKFSLHTGSATMRKMDAATSRCRDAVAVALGVKPWDVQVTPTSLGGYHLELPANYVPSKHDSKLLEVAEQVVGRFGWYVQTDPALLKAEIIPSDPPTFPALVPYPMADEPSNTWDLPLGVSLGEGGKDGSLVHLPLSDAPGALISGTAGGGKSVGVNALIYGALRRGYELAIIDVPHKAVDYAWCQDFVRPAGFGCASPEASLATLSIIYEEEKLSRAALLANHGAQKIQDLPSSIRPRPIFIIVDEVTGLFALEPVPKGIKSSHPLVKSAQEHNLVVQTIAKTVAKIAAELRFVGVRIVLSTQMAQGNTGVSVPLKTNLLNRVLFGANPNDQARGHALLDPRSVPKVPAHIQADEAASRGVAVAEMDGHAPCVLKGFYATTDSYRQDLLARGIARTDQAEPSAEQIDRYTPNLDEEATYEGGRLDGSGFGQVDGRDLAFSELKGAAKAAHDSGMLAEQTRRDQHRRTGL